MDAYLHVFLNSAENGGKWATWRSGVISQGKEPLVSTEEEARWGLIVGLDALEKSLIPASNCKSISSDYTLYSELNVALLDNSRESKKGCK
jgi:hypothetical protein